MIELDIFSTAVKEILGRDLSGNPEQRRIVEYPQQTSLFIVAGPGSGKTTAIALRILKLVFVDDVPPEAIMATTFTRKAAGELRSRILGWGDKLRTHFTVIMPGVKAGLDQLDLNRMTTGTLDSICHSEFHGPGGSAPVIVEDFIAKGFLLRYGLFESDRFRDESLRKYVADLNGTKFINTTTIIDTIMDLYHRLYNDQADRAKFENDRRGDCPPHPGISIALKAIDDYCDRLKKSLLIDYVQLATEFLEQLRDGTLADFRNGILHLFVDEYQDTNLLQESIYFEIAKRTLTAGGSLTVVGDDDQSLYRFRGATVNLFREFPERFKDRFCTYPTKIFLSDNYRSTQRIVDFCNIFVGLDAKYRAQRVSDKPRTRKARAEDVTEWPVLGLFRSDKETLAEDLAQFIYEVVKGTGVDTPMLDGNKLKLQIDPKGSAADCVLLCSSPRELNGSGRQRLPKLLKDKLRSYEPPIEVFNPRGQDLASVDSVKLLCGLMLECIDPCSGIQSDIDSRLPKETVNNLRQWRSRAARERECDTDLDEFVKAWQNRRPLRRSGWPRNVHLNDLSYKLVYWIPKMQNDIEGLVYLEAVTRTIHGLGTAGLSGFRSRFVRDGSDPDLERRSVQHLIWNVFVPIASGAIDIEEDLLDVLPPDRLAVMSIHQAKGLEFPLVIVDVGSDFNISHRKQAFKRFPRDEGRTCRLENEVRPYTQLGRDRRHGINRAFDDLIRQYFVSYSRAQDVLLLVGTDAVKDRIPHLATGWDRRKKWRWGEGLPNLHHIRRIHDAPFS